MLKGVDVVEYKGRVQINLSVYPKPCANMGCVLVLPLATKTLSTVWGFDDTRFHTKLVCSMLVNAYSHHVGFTLLDIG